MEERISPDNPSSQMEAEARIKVLADQLATAAKDLNKWKLEFEVTVEPTPEGLTLVVLGKVGSRGARKRFSAEEAAQWIVDKHDIANALAEQFVLTLMKEQAYTDLMPELSRGLDNISRLSGGKSAL